jgi:hypothetical protein
VTVRRRQFLVSATLGITAACASKALGAQTPSDERPAGNSAVAPSKPATIIAPRTADDLRQALDKRSAVGSGLVCLKPESTITSTVENVPIAGETSIHALLVPENVGS